MTGYIKYKHKPTIVHARQLTGATVVVTPEGEMTGNAGDFLVVGTKDEKYIVQKDIFFNLYDEVFPGED